MRPIPYRYRITPIRLFRHPRAIRRLIFLRAVQQQGQFSNFHRRRMVTSHSLYPIPPNMNRRYLMRLQNSTIVTIRGASPFPTHDLRPNIPHDKGSNILLISSPSTQITHYYFLTRHQTIIQKTIICRGRFGIPRNLHRGKVRAFFRMNFHFVSQSGSTSNQFYRELSLLLSGHFTISLFEAPTTPQYKTKQ